ncbi:hypothetical protein KI387_015500 [Taxus chinensis]|uniref:Condensin complex subunit 2 n=1 Tax=Taxus chinensis TaxID=29808 RepID=A0AA38GD29_TAXCH|nr:hypothetical protein KI387_015500 [Taxus chinensis]
MYRRRTAKASRIKGRQGEGNTRKKNSRSNRFQIQLGENQRQKNQLHAERGEREKEREVLMARGVNNRTPLKAKAGARTRSLVANDDDTERAQARANAPTRRKSLLAQAPVEEPSSALLLDNHQILDLFQNCIRLATENKINQRNTWELSLIDHLSDIIKVEENDTETNFQKASCTLEAGVKIYSLRVDSVHCEAYKVLGGINRTGAGVEETEGEDVDGDQQEGDEKEPGKKISNPSTTLESSFDALNIKKFDVAFTVDPLYHQTSAHFDEGGAKGLLLNTLSVYNDCRIVFDSLDTPGNSMKVGMTQNKESLDTIDMLFIKDCIEQMVIGMQTKREISPTLQEILRSLDDPYRNSAEAITYIQNSDETIDRSVDGEDAMDGSFDVQPDEFECNENVGGVEDNLNNMSPDSHGSFDQEKTEVRFGYSDFVFEDDKNLMSEHTLDYLFLGMGVSSKSNAWAGPEHWKFRRLKDVQQSSDVQNEVSAKDNKSKKRKREPFSVDFLNPTETENVTLFGPPKSQRTLLLPQNSAFNRTTLPEDCHYQPEEFVKLFLLPSVMCIGKKGRTVNDDFLEHANSFEQSVMWDNKDGFDPTWDDAQDDSDVENLNVNMVVQPRKVQKIEVDYDKTSKQVDVHVLKRTLWFSIQDVCSTTKMDEGQKAETAMSFQGLLSNFPADCGAAAPEDISVHLCFICLLHLANEHCLSIQDQASLDDLSIRMPVESQKFNIGDGDNIVNNDVRVDIRHVTIGPWKGLAEKFGIGKSHREEDYGEEHEEETSNAREKVKSDHTPFKVETKVEIKSFEGQVDAELLDKWLKQLEVYFSVHNVTEAQRITFARLKIEGHALVWWETHLTTCENKKASYCEILARI